MTQLRQLLTRWRYLLVLGILLAFAVPALNPVSAEDGPDDFIRLVAEEAIKSLTNERITVTQREDHFRQLLRQTFELKLIARFTLGRFWRRASAAQQKEYTK